MRLLVLLMVLVLFCPRPAIATFTTFSASGTLTRLDETTFHLQIGGGLWGNDPLLSPAYPLGAYTVSSDYDLYGPFGTPFNPEGGMYYDLSQDHAHAGFLTWRFAGLGWFDFDFVLPEAPSRLYMNLTIYADIWQFVMNSPYDQYFPVGTLRGSGTMFADLPTTIGASNPVTQTPESSSTVLILLGFAVLSLGRRFPRNRCVW